ncbi:MAG: hypothetical protein ACKPKO_12270, partial [Candidatus Fonsibacter sp.]
IGHNLAICISTAYQHQASCSPSVPHDMSVLIKLTSRHLRYHLTNVPPEPKLTKADAGGTGRRPAAGGRRTAEAWATDGDERWTTDFAQRTTYNNRRRTEDGPRTTNHIEQNKPHARNHPNND